MRVKRLARNMVSSLALQMITIICGFILPQFMLRGYGSEINGLVNSIARFLGVISLMEMGLGATVQSSLYRPLAEKDNAGISKVIASGNRFFRRLAYVLLVYIFVLIWAYPEISNQSFSRLYTAVLITTMGISTFTQYYFGIMDRLLLTADQRGYIQDIVQMITLLVNTAACVCCILAGYSIHVVKLVTAGIYLVRPLLIRRYIHKHYEINRKISYETEPIEQKWNGIAQHIAAYILDGTDSIVLTVFASLAQVSVYSVYYLVIGNLRSLLVSLTGGARSLMGEMWAKKELDKLKSFFAVTEWGIHTGVTYVFGCAAILIVPFVRVYTKGITDADYDVPLFAVLLTLANALICLRLPYNFLILVAGHYKQTQSNYIIAAILNIVLSVLLVVRFGLVGVAVGTLAAMLYQTIWMAYYDSKHLIRWPFHKFLKQTGIDVLSIISGFILTRNMTMATVSYLSWFILALKVAAVWLLLTVGINGVFYRKNVAYLLKSAGRLIRRNG